MEHPTVQDIFLRFYPQYLDKYAPSPQQSKVANCIIYKVIIKNVQ